MLNSIWIKWLVRRQVAARANPALAILGAGAFDLGVVKLPLNGEVAGFVITNRWSCRLRLSSDSIGCRRCGSLRVGDSAAQLNSMLGRILAASVTE